MCEISHAEPCAEVGPFGGSQRHDAGLQLAHDAGHDPVAILEQRGFQLLLGNEFAFLDPLRAQDEQAVGHVFPLEMRRSGG